jgi:hypothetical protein
MDGFQFRTSSNGQDTAYDGPALEKVQIHERKRRGSLNYTRGVNIMGTLGDLTLRDTASLDLITVTTAAREAKLGIGSALMHEFLRQIKEADFQYVTAIIIHPAMIKLIERTLQEEQLSDRIYYHPSQLSWDVPSGETFHRFTPLDPDVAAASVTERESGYTSTVNCLMKL